MGHTRLQFSFEPIWDLARRQHGVVARSQLLGLGMSSDAIQHRVERGRLHAVWRGVYAVGRPELSDRGRWMGAVLSCGPSALLSHRSAAALWGFRLEPPPEIEVVVGGDVSRRRPGIRVHRRSDLSAANRRSVDGIPVTDPISMLIDLASCLGTSDRLERAVNEADRLDLADPDEVRDAVESLPPRPGTGRLRRLLSRDAFRRTESGLERSFLSIVRTAGLPLPETQAGVNGYRVDFFWPSLGLIVETDGLRYHRTAAQQATDRRRDQAHTAAGLTVLRFSESQIRYERRQVRATLVSVAARLEAAHKRG